LALRAVSTPLLVISKDFRVEAMAMLLHAFPTFFLLVNNTAELSLRSTPHMIAPPDANRKEKKGGGQVNWY
jgi:hypothetical protein